MSMESGSQPTPEELAYQQAVADSNSGKASIDLDERQKVANEAGTGAAYRAGIVSTVFEFAEQNGGVVRTE